MKDWSDDVTVATQEFVVGVQLHLTNREARFLETILGKMNGNAFTNPLHGLYSELKNLGIYMYDTDLPDIDIHNATFNFEDK